MAGPPPPPPGYELDTPAPPAAAPAIPSPPPGYEVEAPGKPAADDRFMGAGVKPGDEATITHGMTLLTERGAPPSLLHDYLAANGSPEHPDMTKWIDTAYADALKNGHPTKQSDWDVIHPNADQGLLHSIGAGAQAGMLSGLDDEYKAAAATAGNYIGRGLGINDSDMPIGDTYRHFRDENRQDKYNSFNEHPIAYGAGYLGGGALGAGKYARTGLAEAAPTLGGRLLQAAGMGGAEGALTGAGNADGGVADTLAGSLEGGLGGAVLGPLAYPLGGAVRAIANKAASLVRPNNLNSGLDVLAHAAPQNEADMLARRQAMESAGVPARPLDVVDPRGLAVTSRAANRTYENATAMQRHANQVYTEAPERIAAQAHQIDPLTPTSRQLARAQASEQTDLSGPEYDSTRDLPVPITDEVKQAIETPAGQAALRAVGKLMTPAEYAPLKGLIQASAKSMKTPPIDVDTYLSKNVPGFDKMGDAAKDTLRKEIGPTLAQDDPYTNATLSVDTANKFGRVLTGKVATDTPALYRGAKALKDAVEGAARKAYPEYAQAQANFAARAGVGDAARVEGRFAGADFLKTPSDDYEHMVGGASTTPAAVMDPATGQPTVSEADALKSAARTQMVDKAGAGAGQGAVPMARQIATGPEQANRNEILLGPEGAQNLQHGMAQEVQRVENTQAVDPRGAPKEDELPNRVMTAAAYAAATGNKWHLVKAARDWLNQEAIGKVDAERLTRNMIDPKQTDHVIQYLVQKGASIQKATSFVHSVTSNWAGKLAGTAVASEPTPAPPGSIRVLNRSITQ